MGGHGVVFLAVQDNSLNTLKKLLFEFQLIFHTHSVVLVDAENRRREQSWLKNIGAQPVADEQMVTKD